jgi:hypothetical protein
VCEFTEQHYIASLPNSAFTYIDGDDSGCTLPAHSIKFEEENFWRMCGVNVLINLQKSMFITMVEVEGELLNHVNKFKIFYGEDSTTPNQIIFSTTDVGINYRSYLSIIILRTLRGFLNCKNKSHMALTHNIT